MSTVENRSPRTVVVGVDASPESSAALEWARGVADVHDRIVVVHAWEIPIVAGYDTALVVDPIEVERLSTQGLDEYVAKADDARLVPAVRQGHAGRAIVDEGDDADMIVVGHSGDSRVAMMLGSTANYVLHHTSKPVVIVRGDHHEHPESVVVGVDDHDLADGDENESVRALQWAYRLPGVREIRVQHAWFLPALAVGTFPTADFETNEMDHAAQALAERVIEAAGMAPDGVDVIAEPVRGTPGFALIEASHDADLVVVGSRGRGGFKGLLLGSTSAEVAAHSQSPVAVIR